MAWPKEILPLRRARISPVRFSDLTTWTGTGSLDTYSSNLRPRCSAEGKNPHELCGASQRNPFTQQAQMYATNWHTKDKVSTTLMIRRIDKHYNVYFCDLYCLVHISLHFSSLISSEAMHAMQRSYNTCCFHVCICCIREPVTDNCEVWQMLYHTAKFWQWWGATNVVLES